MRMRRKINIFKKPPKKPLQCFICRVFCNKVRNNHQKMIYRSLPILLPCGSIWCMYLLPFLWSYGTCTVHSIRSKANCPIRIHGYNLKGIALILVISRVIVPSNQGSINQAVEWIMSQSLPSELLPSHLATRSYGRAIFSRVTHNTKLPGSKRNDHHPASAIRNPPSPLSIIN